MRTHSILFSVLSFLTTIVLVSCNKEYLPKEEPDPSVTCAHDSLVHVAAVEPTNTECGCVEHYFCPSCSKYYSDPNCKTEMESPLLWGKYLVLGADKYYELFEQYYTELGFEQALSGEPKTNFIIASILKNVILDKASDVVEKLFEFLEDDEKKKVDPVFEKISGNLEKIENAILGLANMFKEEKVKEVLNDRERKLFYVRNATHPYFMSVLRQIEGYKKFENVPEDKKKIIASLTNEWYSKGIYNGLTYEDCYLTISELLHFFNGFWTSSKSFPELYDHMAYTSSPWYHQTISIRVMARISDAVSLAEGYLMTCLYYHINNDNSSKEKINMLNVEMKMYDASLEAHPIDTEVEEFTRWMWKAQGADITRFKLRRDIWHFKKNGVDVIDQKLNELISKKTSWEADAPFTSVYDASVDYCNQHGLAKNEQNIIYQYYKKSNITDYYSMLTKAGFRNVTPYNNNGRLVCYSPDVDLRTKESENIYTYQTCRWLFAYCTDYREGGDGGIIQFRTALDQNFNTLAKEKTPFRTKMDWKYYHGSTPRCPGALIKIGTRSVYDFEALVKTSQEYEPIDIE